MLLSWFANRSLASKIALSFGVLIAVGFAGATSTYVSLSRIKSSKLQTAQINQALQAVDKLTVAILERQDDIRASQATNNELPTELAEAKNREIDADFLRLEAFTTATPLQQARIVALKNVLAQWRLQTSSTGLVSPGGGIQSAGEGVLARVRRQLETIESEERRISEQRSFDADRLFASATTINALGPLTAILMSTLLAFVLQSAIVRPIATLTHVTSDLADGDTSVEIPFKKRQEEIGAMARALEVFRLALDQSKHLKNERSIAESWAKQERAEAMAAMADRFDAAVGSVVSVVSSATKELEASASSLQQVATRTAEDVQSVTISTDATLQTMQSVVSDARNLQENASEMSARMTRSAKVAAHAIKQANQTRRAMEDLALTAQEIGDIVGLISSVASQTNFLALNATIEASRAGEAGRGFSVVAGEVKSLADQTAKATENIGRQIQSIQSATKRSLLAIEEISETIGEMVHATAEVTAAGDANGTATEGMAYRAHSSACASAVASSRLEKVADGAATTGVAAERMLNAARDLARQTEFLRRESERFTATVRTA